MNNVNNFEPACLPYLDIEVGAATADVLAAILITVGMPTVLLRNNGRDAFTAATLLPLITLIQQHNAAALLADDINLVCDLQADGVHLSPGPQVQTRYMQARENLGDHLIVGACAGKSRHDAMVLGELGADYVGFGAPEVVKDQSKAKSTRLHLIAWWAELFEVPCVAFDAYDEAEISELADAGADFVSIFIPAGISAAEAVGKARFASEIISQNACKETP